MMRVITKKSTIGTAPIVRSFAVNDDAEDVVNFINKLSNLSNGAVSGVDRREIENQISVAAIIVENTKTGEIIGYMGSRIVGKTEYNLPMIELRSGAISREYGGNGINGDNRMILLESIREKYPDSIIISIKNGANGKWSAKSLQGMGFLYPRNPNTLEVYKRDPYMKGVGIPEEFFEKKKNGTPDRTVWIGIQTKDSYDKFYESKRININDPNLLSIAQGMLRREFGISNNLIASAENFIENMLRTGDTL